RLRLRAREASPAELEDEVQGLAELGEPVAPELVGEHLDALLAQGRSAEARRLVEGVAPEERAPREAADLGWGCYPRHASDLAHPLLARAFLHSPTDPKLGAALEAAALRGGLVEECAALYLRLAADDGAFHGRIKRLLRRAAESRT